MELNPNKISPTVPNTSVTPMVFCPQREMACDMKECVRVMKAQGMTATSIAKALGKSREWVAQVIKNKV